MTKSDAGNHETEDRFKRALEHYQAGQIREAEKICKDIYCTDPEYSPALHLLGMVAYQRGRYDVAVNLMGAAIQIQSDVAFYHRDMGNVFLSQNKIDESILCYRNVLRLNPNFVETYYLLSVALVKKDLLDEAMQSLVIALKLRPDYTDALYQAGFILGKQNKPDEAIACFEKLLEIEPARTEALFALGAALGSIDREDEAIDCYGKVLQIEPDHVYTLNNLGLLFKEQGEIEQAMNVYQKAIEISPDLAGPHWNLSHVLLLTGNLQAGWKEFEWRLRKDDWQKANFRSCKAPLWKGESFAGKTLFIHDEQGLGDTIQFIRYLPMVKALGGDIIFETQGPLIGLLKDFPGIDRLIPRSADGVLPTDMDFYVPLLSLPAIFNTTLDTIPDTVPYLHADADKTRRWRERLPGDGFKVGIVWAGGPKNPNERNRSCRLRQFESIANISGVRLIGMQKGKAAEQVKDLPTGMEVINYGPELEDFTDTMALIENLDLIIAVDTSVAHLAGAMGKPIWLVLTFAHHWPWLLNRTDSPWYPSMRIYRQKDKGCWSPVFEEIKKNLNTAVAEREAEKLTATRNELQINIFQTPRPAVMVVSHERSGTHFLMNSIASCYGYISNPWIDIDYHRFNINFYDAPSISGLIQTISNNPVANIIKDHHQAVFYGDQLNKITQRTRIFYIYRNPTKVLLSFWRLIYRLHWAEGPQTGDAVEFARAEPCGYCLPYQMGQISSMARRWEVHVEGWLDAASGNEYIVPIRYEDLDSDYETTMASLSPYLETIMTGSVRPDRYRSVIPRGPENPAGREVKEQAVRETCLELIGDSMKRMGYA